jgi:2-polyprenyl-3-methyl-5-hydroxy-6-metoxy-1,4-benzoquinol methylase
VDTPKGAGDLEVELPGDEVRHGDHITLVQEFVTVSFGLPGLFHRRRSIRKMAASDRHEISGFFDKYSRFYETSTTGASPNRLNMRYLALIDSNLDAIRQASILDLGSHDGRWSFAALANGARKVIGIEGRPQLVEKAEESMDVYGIPQSMYSFVVGDCLQVIHEMEPAAVDTVFCFGLLYHTMHHMSFISEIGRLKPKVLLIDTWVARSKSSIIAIHEEDSRVEGNALNASLLEGGSALVGRPSPSALELMLKSAGFVWRYFDWTRLNITDWTGMRDYEQKWRVSLRAEKMGHT